MTAVANALMEAWSRPHDEFYPGIVAPIEVLEEGVRNGLLSRSFWASYSDASCNDDDLSSEESRRVIDDGGWRDPEGRWVSLWKREEEGGTVWFPVDPDEIDHMVPMYLSTPALDEMAVARRCALPAELDAAEAHAEHIRETDPDAWLAIVTLVAEVRRLREGDEREGGGV